jgi:UDP-3-O-acyl N-acetylglucosamine deacetylase
MLKKKTLKSSIEFQGIGLHTGQMSKIVLHPNLEGTGIVFKKRSKNKTIEIPASYQSVASTILCTEIQHHAEKILTIEHLLSACHGSHIWDLYIECVGDEIPILDGSALFFIELISRTGTQDTPFDLEPFEIISPLRKEFQDQSFYEVYPYPCLQIEYSIDFSKTSNLIGHQKLFYQHTQENYLNEIASARTFCLEPQIESLKKQGFIKGGSLENAMVYQKDSVLNPEGLRQPDECVRHKVLDLIGDLTLLGQPLKGYLKIFKGGHKLHLDLVQYLAENKDEFCLFTGGTDIDFKQKQSVFAY